MKYGVSLNSLAAFHLFNKSYIFTMNASNIFSQLQFALYHYFLLCLYSCLFQSLTVEMAKRKVNLRTHAKSVTLDGTST